MYTKNFSALFAAVLALTPQVLAAPTGSEVKRAMHNGIDHQNSFGLWPEAKRDIKTELKNKGYGEKNMHSSREVHNDIDHIDNLAARGDSSLTVGKTHDCKDVPDVFEEAGPFRAKANDWCSIMVKQLPELKVSTIKQTVTDGAKITKDKVIERGYDHPVTVYTTLTDAGKKAVSGKEPEVNEDALRGLCIKAISSYGTKGDGKCTAEKKYQTGRFIIHGETTTAIKPGISCTTASSLAP